MKVIAFAAAALALSGAAALAQPFEGKGSVQGWNIFFNGKTGGCFMEGQQGDYVVQMGTEAAMLGQGDGDIFGFVAVYAPAEIALKDGEMLPIFVSIDGELFGGDVVGVEKQGFHGGYVISNSTEYADALSDGSVMTIAPDTPSATEISLSGTRAAIDAVRGCQAETAG